MVTCKRGQIAKKLFQQVKLVNVLISVSCEGTAQLLTPRAVDGCDGLTGAAGLRVGTALLAG